ncbi:MAG: hypothetical protein IT298_04070 [Chloroflexi bacterium]|nr:MAG: hypothetical protein UZ13_03770 [Chloroflexi bacterium OLB13]MBV6437218.1 hypothetical protein [Anaerolineae bacterium]MCC6564917.1 hypothetical protein [Chloroflexota bacterium]MDL1914914.1 hypothetical protein [Anaerolineae bacterium CFX4]MCO6445604.1 hypothetical protein [Anaerolineae bacterium]
MNTTQRVRRMGRTWAVFGLLMVALHVALIAAWVAFDPAQTRSVGTIIVLVVVYLGVLAVLVIGFASALGQASLPVEYREAAASGIELQARVIDVQQTRWHSRPGDPINFAPRPTRRVYQIRVQVTPEDGQPYEAELTEWLISSDVPKVGATVPVKVHPRYPEVAVLVRDHRQ